MKKNNMLHHRWIIFVVIFQLVLIWCSPLSVYAAIPNGPIDYTTLDYTVKEGPLYNQVTVPLDFDYYEFTKYNDIQGAIEYTVKGEHTYQLTMMPHDMYSLFIYPVSSYGLSLDNIPVGSKIVFDIVVGVDGDESYSVPTFAQRLFYTTEQNVWITPITQVGVTGKFWEPITLTYDIVDLPSNAANIVPSLRVNRFKTDADFPATYTFTISSVSLVMDISNGHWEQWQTAQTGKMISDATDSITGAIGDMGSDIVGSVNDMSTNLQSSMDEVGNKIDQSADLIISGNEYTDNLADESNEEISAAAGNLEGLGNQLSAIPKPDFSSFKFGIGDLVGDTASVDLLTAPILEIWESPVALGMLTVVITLVIVSWVFFGKK